MNGKRNGPLELDLPNTPGIFGDIYQDLMNKRIVDIEHVKNLNDFKPLLMSWVFDINFESTMQEIKSRRYMEMILDVLPGTEKIETIFEVAQDDVSDEAIMYFNIPTDIPKRIV